MRIFYLSMAIGLSQSLFLSGCATTNSEVDQALARYKNCIDSGKSATYCDRYWEERNAAISRSSGRSFSSSRSSMQEVDDALARYRNCVDSGGSASKCDPYWEERNAAIRRLPSETATNHQESSPTSNAGVGKAAGALIMGIICSASANPSACMSGAADSLSGRESETNDKEKRPGRAEKRVRELEQSLRTQCLYRGGIYNSVTGCNR